MAENILSNIIGGVVKKVTGQNKYKKSGISWLEMRFLKNMPDDKVNKVPLFGKNILVPGRVGFLHALREIFFEEIYKIQLPEDAYIIDCGANIGLSIIFFKKIAPSSKILAYEPDNINYSLLKKNVEAFRFAGVDIKQEAVWTKEDLLSFTNDGTMSSRLSMKGDYKVKTIRLKDHLTSKVDFLKMDIEGAEYAVLKDIEDSLLNVQNLFIEYHGSFAQNNELTDIFHILSASGFSYYIKEATPVYKRPFFDPFNQSIKRDWDVQLNIFCFRKEQP